MRCTYFVYADREEDRVLETVIQKVQTIQKELGSLATVVMDNVERELKHGIGRTTRARIEKAADVPGREVAKRELEEQRQLKKLRDEIEAAGRTLNRSRKVMEYDDALLRSALDAGFALAGAGALQADGTDDGAPLWRLPTLPDSWSATLDTLRPERELDEPFWDWRRRPPEPVMFQAADRLDAPAHQLHLQHPVVRRVLSRFLAQGYAQHDLSRVTVLRNPHDALPRVLAFARLSLFGKAATRLHDEILSIAALWRDGEGALKPFAERADREAVERLEELLKDPPALDAVPKATREKLLRSAQRDFQALWTHLEEAATARAAKARQELEKRGRTEADELRKLLETQRAAIEKELEAREGHQWKQLGLPFASMAELDDLEKRQIELENKSMRERLAQLPVEIETEPEQIAQSYDVVFQRLAPVGLIYLWPSTR